MKKVLAQLPGVRQVHNGWRAGTGNGLGCVGASLCLTPRSTPTRATLCRPLLRSQSSALPTTHGELCSASSTRETLMAPRVSTWTPPVRRLRAGTRPGTPRARRSSPEASDARQVRHIRRSTRGESADGRRTESRRPATSVSDDRMELPFTRHPASLPPTSARYSACDSRGSG